ENEGQISPDANVLVGKHYNLVTVIWHVSRQITVAVYHAFAETPVGASDGEGTFAVGVPIGKQSLEVLFIPGEEKFREFVVIDCISVWRISEPYIRIDFCLSRIFQLYLEWRVNFR